MELLIVSNGREIAPDDGFSKGPAAPSVDVNAQQRCAVVLDEKVCLRASLTWRNVADPDGFHSQPRRVDRAPDLENPPFTPSHRRS
ncbi:MAG TPA: hypothetical protein VH083_08375 [Myxococcales bacterium]|nr:hypothetical protein [Myxococcales bacterium]